MTASDFFDYVEGTINSDKAALETINRFLEKAPPGSVSLENRNGSLFCRQIMYSGGRISQKKYIKKADWDLARDLAKKAYYLELKDFIEKEIAILTPCYNEFNPEGKYELYNTLSSDRKSLVSSFYETVKDKVDAWRNREYIPNSSFPEALTFETEKGELRRSKSERDISNALDACEGILEYRYEPRIYFPASGKYLHPDFYIINTKTGKEYLWEHFGGFGIDNYDADYVFKMQCYMMESPEIKNSLIMTYETTGYPLQPRMIKTMIKQMLDSK